MSGKRIAYQFGGLKFGKLQVLNRAGKDKYNNATWNCVCDCGKVKTIKGLNLKNGRTRSCGCLPRPVKTAVCHPERKHYGLGLCYPCWRRQPLQIEKSRKGSRRWRKNLRKRIGEAGYKWYLFIRNLKNLYDLSHEKYLGMLNNQNHQCPCGRVFGELYKPVVDHDHACCKGVKSCGECVRGLLCSRCNTVLGMLNEDCSLLPEFLLNYLGHYV